MPIYEYVCERCGHHLEIMQKMSDKPLSKCPQCRGKLEKIFSQTSFQLKGSGWYASDTVVPAERPSPCPSYGPLSITVYMSIAVMRPSFLKPTFTREWSAGRARPM